MKVNEQQINEIFGLPESECGNKRGGKFIQGDDNKFLLYNKTNLFTSEKQHSIKIYFFKKNIAFHVSPNTQCMDFGKL